MTVDSCGAMSGTADGGTLTASGTVDANGRMNFSVATQNGVTASICTGTIDASGNVAGTWIDATGSSIGTFHGKRGAPPDTSAPVGPAIPVPSSCDPRNDTCPGGTHCGFSCSEPAGINCLPGAAGTVPFGGICHFVAECQTGSASCLYASAGATDGTCIAACATDGDCLAGQKCTTVSVRCGSGAFYSTMWCR
jgi:hypothetical protein